MIWLIFRNFGGWFNYSSAHIKLLNWLVCKINHLTTPKSNHSSHCRAIVEFTHVLRHSERSCRELISCFLYFMIINCTLRVKCVIFWNVESEQQHVEMAAPFCSCSLSWAYRRTTLTSTLPLLVNWRVVVFETVVDIKTNCFVSDLHFDRLTRPSNSLSQQATLVPVKHNSESPSIPRHAEISSEEGDSLWWLNRDVHLGVWHLLASPDTWGGKGEIAVGFQISVPISGSEREKWSAPKHLSPRRPHFFFFFFPLSLFTASSCRLKLV